MTLPCVGCAMKDAFPLRGTTSFIFLVKKEAEPQMPWHCESKTNREPVCKWMVFLQPFHRIYNGMLKFVRKLFFESQSQLDKYWHFSIVRPVGCHPKASAFDQLGMILTNQLSEEKKKKSCLLLFFFKWNQINPVCACMCERHPDALFLILFKVLFILRN